ncbi:MAG: ATP-binding protein [Crenarchaeota archaeon]|nr:ATP-binding protein [Thermoproteota archaeon]
MAASPQAPPGGVEVGVVLSGASASLVPVMLRRDRELEVREEDLAVVVDPRLEGYLILGVFRWITRHEPFLRRYTHNIYAEKPEALDHDMVMPFSNAYLEVYGGVCLEPREPHCERGGLVANVYAPTPGSRVYRLRDAGWLSGFLTVGEPLHVGVHKYTGWRVPLDAAWTPYHIGVFGATGTGKSRLVLKLVSELAAKGFSAVVFDHSGVDYAPAARAMGWRVVRSGELRISPVIFASTVARYLGVTGYQRDLVELVALCHALRVYGYREQSECQELLGPAAARGAGVSGGLHRFTGSNSSSGGAGGGLEEFLAALSRAAARMNMRDATVRKLRIMARLQVPRHVFEGLPSRRLEPRSLVEEAASGGVVVIDMSDEQDIEVKRAIVASVAEAVWELVRERGEPVNVGLVVDEAQNYACEYCGDSGRALETVAREGRKWGYWLLVASQRVARDIRPGVRGNLGTVFFSRLQSSGDLQELSGYLDLGRLNEASLALLERREFYAAGLLNPLRRPLLLRVDEVTVPAGGAARAS